MQSFNPMAAHLSLPRTLLAFVFHWSRIERQMEEELRSRPEIRADDLERQELPRAEAERRGRSDRSWRLLRSASW
jgi:hypothetical protein